MKASSRRLVIEFRSRGGIDVWEIKASDEHPVDRRLDIAAVRVVGIAGQAPADFHRLSTKEGTPASFRLKTARSTISR
jgi:hypothetical protein